MLAQNVYIYMTIISIKNSKTWLRFNSIQFFYVYKRHSRGYTYTMCMWKRKGMIICEMSCWMFQKIDSQKQIFLHREMKYGIFLKFNTKFTKSSRIFYINVRHLSYIFRKISYTENLTNAIFIQFFSDALEIPLGAMREKPLLISMRSKSSASFFPNVDCIDNADNIFDLIIMIIVVRFSMTSSFIPQFPGWQTPTQTFSTNLSSKTCQTFQKLAVTFNNTIMVIIFYLLWNFHCHKKTKHSKLLCFFYSLFEIKRKRKEILRTDNIQINEYRRWWMYRHLTFV